MIDEAEATMHPKKCMVCHKRYDATSWNDLRYRGVSCGLEFRDCSCGNTLCVEVGLTSGREGKDDDQRRGQDEEERGDR